MLGVRRFMRHHWWELAAALGIVLITAVSFHNYLLFHGVVEAFSAVVAISLFTIGWNSRRFTHDGFFLFVGIGFLFIGVIGLLHMLAYKGMGVFPSDADLATQLWLIVRYLQAATFLAAPFLLKRAVPIKWVFGAYAAGTGILLGLVAADLFPAAFVEGSGLTLFKTVSEYVVSACLLGGIILLWRRKSEFRPDVFHGLIGSLALMLFTGLAFTLYRDVYGIMNMVGHVLQLVAFYLLYRAMISTALQQPYETFFRDLDRRERQLRDLNRTLEQRVAQRTRELRKAQEALIRKEKMASLGQLAGTISHDLRNPIGNISNSLYAMRARVKDKDALRQIDLAQEEVQRCSLLLSELMDFSRSRPLEREPAKLQEIIASAVRAVPTPKDVALVIRHDELPEMEVDAPKLQRVFINMISNAYQAMPRGGKLEITARKLGKNVEITLRDTGVGIPPQDLPRLFEPLFTTKRGGVGLGMVIVKDVIEKHNGTIAVKSRPGKGTTFTLSLPGGVHALAAHR